MAARSTGAVRLASFSPSEAAFTGFRIVREHPKVLIAWSIAHFAISWISTLAMVMLWEEWQLQTKTKAGKKQKSP